jgi:hypothetical protein
MTKGQAQVAAAEKAIQAKDLGAAAKKMRQAVRLAEEAHALVMRQIESGPDLSVIAWAVSNAKNQAHDADLKLRRKAIARRSEAKRILEDAGLPA